MIIEVVYNHYDMMLEALEYSHKSNSEHDLCFVDINSKKITSSSLLLLLFSDMYKTIKNSISDECTSTIIIPVTVSSIQNLLIFLVNGEISSSFTNIEEIIDTARLLGLPTEAFSLDKGFEPAAATNFILGKKEVDIESLQQSVVTERFHNLKCEIKMSEAEVDKAPLVKFEKLFKDETSVVYCPKCAKKYSRLTKLRDHYGKKHLQENSFGCRFCGKLFVSRFSLMDHSVNCHIVNYDNANLCTVCGESFDGIDEILNQSMLSAHEQLFHRKKCSFSLCYICYKGFENESKLSQHFEESHFCTIDASSLEENRLVHQISTYAHKPKPLKIRKDHMSNKKPRKNIVSKRDLSKIHACSFPGCDKKFSHIGSREYHERFHNEDYLKFSCQTCGRKFPYECNLRVHEEIHNPWRKCDNCGKILGSSKALNLHVQSCRNEYNYQCTTCGKPFTEWFKLNNHIALQCRNIS